MAPTAQQRDIELLLSERGWRVVSRERPVDPWFATEVWTAESNWSPQGTRVLVCFLAEPMADTQKVPPEVWAVAVGDKLPSSATPANAVPLRPNWESRHRAEFTAALDALRSPHP